VERLSVRSVRKRLQSLPVVLAVCLPRLTVPSPISPGRPLNLGETAMSDPSTRTWGNLAGVIGRRLVASTSVSLTLRRTVP
jgi:hypothetical protein